MTAILLLLISISLNASNLPDDFYEPETHLIQKKEGRTIGGITTQWLLTQTQPKVCFDLDNVMQSSASSTQKARIQRLCDQHKSADEWSEVAPAKCEEGEPYFFIRPLMTENLKSPVVHGILVCNKNSCDDLRPSDRVFYQQKALSFSTCGLNCMYKHSVKASINTEAFVKMNPVTKIFSLDTGTSACLKIHKNKSNVIVNYISNKVTCPTGFQPGRGYCVRHQDNQNETQTTYPQQGFK
jgi:hypothetical protein